MLSVSDFKRNRKVWKICCKALNMKFYKNNFGGSRAVPFTQTERHDVACTE